MDGHTPGDNIRHLIQRHLDNGISQIEIARRCRISQGTVYRYLHLEQEPRLEIVMKFADGLQIPIEDILGQETRLPRAIIHGAPTQQIPVLTKVQAGAWRSRVVPPYPGVADDYVDTDLRGAHLFALRVEGDSMLPEFQPGELIIIQPNIEPMQNMYVVVWDKEDGEAAILKQLKRLKNSWYLHPLNPAYEDLPLGRHHKIVGKVIRRQKDYS